jgi:hypothetical protein
MATLYQTIITSLIGIGLFKCIERFMANRYPDRWYGQVFVSPHLPLHPSPHPLPPSPNIPLHNSSSSPPPIPSRSPLRPSPPPTLPPLRPWLPGAYAPGSHGGRDEAFTPAFGEPRSRLTELGEGLTGTRP